MFYQILIYLFELIQHITEIKVLMNASKKTEEYFRFGKNWPSFSISFVLEGFLCSESKSDINPHYKKKRGFRPRFIDPKNAVIG